MRTVQITAENANASRELFRQSIETYNAFENIQTTIKRQILEMVGGTVGEKSPRFAKPAITSKL
jgi:hypothetical protein